LRGDAHPPSALSDRAFEDVAYTQLAADPLYVDRLAFVDRVALVGEGAVACDYEQPVNAAERGVIYSIMPSAKYSGSGSRDIFWNGSTTIDGLSGEGKASSAPTRALCVLLFPHAE